MNSLKVLIVDDSPIISRKLTMMVELLGYKVVKTAATGTEAIAAYRACLPDVVTMDITMPDMDGIEVAARLQETHAIPVIYLTAYSEDSTLERARRA